MTFGVTGWHVPQLLEGGFVFLGHFTESAGLMTVPPAPPG